MLIIVENKHDYSSILFQLTGGIIEVKRSDFKNPAESSWYLVKYVTGSVTYYNEENNAKNKICSTVIRLLYWKVNVWLENPKSYKIIDEDKIIAWKKVPDDFNNGYKDIRVIY